MVTQGRVEQLAERLAHLPTPEWADAILELCRETVEECRARFFVTYPWWLSLRDLALDDESVETLLDLARTNRREDFMFFAGSCGVLPRHHEELWEGTRRRLGKA